MLDTGLTLTGATFGGVWGVQAQGRVTQTTIAFYSSQYEVYLQSLLDRPIELALNEALVLRNNVVSVIGDNINGFVQFYEK